MQAFAERAAPARSKQTDAAPAIHDDDAPEQKAALAPATTAISEGGGQALDAELRDKLETAFGRDLGGVRVHADSESATDLGARAYAKGADIHFAPGELAPQSPSGMALLAHELTHVVQQADAPAIQAKGCANSDHALEAEADTLGERVAAGEAVTVEGRSTGGIQRAPDDQIAAKQLALKSLLQRFTPSKDGGEEISSSQLAKQATALMQSVAFDVDYHLAGVPTAILDGLQSLGKPAGEALKSARKLYEEGSIRPHVYAASMLPSSQRATYQAWLRERCGHSVEVRDLVVGDLLYKLNEQGRYPDGIPELFAKIFETRDERIAADRQLDGGKQQKKLGSGIDQTLVTATKSLADTAPKRVKEILKKHIKGILHQSLDVKFKFLDESAFTAAHYEHLKAENANNEKLDHLNMSREDAIRVTHAKSVDGVEAFYSEKDRTMYLRSTASTHVYVHEAIHGLGGHAIEKALGKPFNEAATEMITLRALELMKTQPKGEFYARERAALDTLMRRVGASFDDLLAAYFLDEVSKFEKGEPVVEVPDVDFSVFKKVERTNQKEEGSSDDESASVDEEREMSLERDDLAWHFTPDVEKQLHADLAKNTVVADQAGARWRFLGKFKVKGGAVQWRFVREDS